MISLGSRRQEAAGADQDAARSGGASEALDPGEEGLAREAGEGKQRRRNKEAGVGAETAERAVLEDKAKER